MRAIPHTVTVRALACLVAIAVAGCSTSTPVASGFSGPARSDVEAMIQELQDDVTELEGLGMDVEQLELHLRMARLQLEGGDTAHAEELAASGLALADEVRDRVDEIIEADLEQRDRDIRVRIASLEDYLREGWEVGADRELAEIEEMVKARNDRAAQTDGRFPAKTYADKLDPIRVVVKDIAESQVKSDFTAYKETLRPRLVKLRGNEIQELQDAMKQHVEDNGYKAKKAYLAALRKEPENYKVLQNLGILQMELGEYGQAVGKLEDAFDIGLTLGEEDGEWYRDFVPDAEPLIAALKETGQGAKVASVQRRHDDRMLEVDAMREERELERMRELTEPEVAEEEAVVEDPSKSEDEKCRQRPVAGQIALIQTGMDMRTVREIICSPDSLKLSDDRAYWYYPTGTVVFENETVLETSTQRVEPES